MRDSDFYDPFEIMQRGFLPSARIRDAARANAAEFWNAQEKILEAMENQASHWFQRRHAGAQAALTTAQQMCQADTQLDALREYQKWAAGAFERLMQDGLECQKQMLAMSRLFAQPLVSGEARMADAASAEARQRVPARPRAA
jgi:hypothetical protein